MKKFLLAGITMIALMPVLATAQSTDSIIADLLASMNGGPSASAKVSATTSAPLVAAPPKPVQASVPREPQQEIMAPFHLFDVDGNTPKADPNTELLKSTLQSLLAQFAVLSSRPIVTAVATTTVSTTTSAKPAAPVRKHFLRNLVLGSHGDDVKELQHILIEGLYMSGEPTGYFGILTKTAVIALQSDRVLDQTGFVGPKTRALLNSTDPKTFVHVQLNEMPAPVSDKKTVRFSLLVTTPVVSAATTSSSTSTATSTLAATDSGTVFTAASTSATSSAASSSPLLAPAPVSVHLSASPTDVPNGGYSLASWSSLNTSFCVASGAWGGILPVFGTAKVGPVRSTIDLILTCMGPGGEDSTTATIVVAGTQ